MRNLFGVLLVAAAVFGFGLGMAFAGGVLYGRNTAASAAVPTATAAAGGGFGGAAAATGTAAAGGGTGAARPAGAGGATLGTVEKVEGNTVTVRTVAGTTQTVTLTPDTELRQTVAAQVSDLQPGQTVTVTGTPGADGSLQARSITIGAAGGQGPGSAPRQASATPGSR
jgi:hypothetical protein